MKKLFCLLPTLIYVILYYPRSEDSLYFLGQNTTAEITNLNFVDENLSSPEDGQLYYVGFEANYKFRVKNIEYVGEYFIDLQNQREYITDEVLLDELNRHYKQKKLNVLYNIYNPNVRIVQYKQIEVSIFHNIVDIAFIFWITYLVYFKLKQ